MTEEIKNFIVETVPVIDSKGGDEPQLSFYNNGKTVLEIHANGDILYNGKKIKNDIEIYYGLKEFLEGAELYNNREIKKLVKDMTESVKKLEKMIL